METFINRLLVIAFVLAVAVFILTLLVALVEIALGFNNYITTLLLTMVV